MNDWRSAAHDQFLEKAFRIRDQYGLQQRTKIYNVDNKIDNLMSDLKYRRCPDSKYKYAKHQSNVSTCLRYLQMNSKVMTNTKKF